MRSLSLATVALLALAGCASPPEAGPAEPTPILVTDPSQDPMGPAGQPHLHDYWGRSQVLDVMDAAVEIGAGPLPGDGILWTGDPIAVAEFRPDSGKVVPQGASEVRVTLTWSDEDPTNAFEDPELWVKTAADSAPLSLGAVDSGATVTVPSTNERNDLPHQVLSAWVFQLVMAGEATPAGSRLAYSGEVSIKVQAVRGLDIPLYPGHPDRWGGAREIALLDGHGELRYMGDPTTGNWNCFGGCPVIHVPADGTVVPYDADHVVVTLRVARGAPATLGLKFHGADDRGFQAPAPSETGPNERTYVIPVGSAGDGPYARQSQWEFVPYVEGPVPDGFVDDAYDITAVAHRDPA